MSGHTATAKLLQPWSDGAEVRFPRRASLRQVDATWTSAGQKSRSSVLTLDLGSAGLVEPASLLYLVSKLIDRMSARLSTRVILPTGGKALAQLARWKAHSVFDDISGSGLVEFENLERLSRRAGSSSRREHPEDRLTFPLELFPRSGRSFDEKLASSVSAGWRDEYVLSNLNRDLMGYGKHVSTHIVHEALMNVVRNANARWIGTCSSYDLPGRSLRRYLTIVVWDDGIPIAESLRAAMNRGAEIQTTVPKRHLRAYRVYVGRSDDDSRLLNSSSVPGSSDPDYLLLLSALYAGVTSDTSRPGAALPEIVAQDATYGQPGMGLFILANSVLDVFGGSLSIRSGLHHLFVAPTRANGNTKHVDYDVQVIQHPESARFTGNMLTVRLPLGEPTGAWLES